MAAGGPIGMSVPGASSLGLGLGDMLGQQAKAETDDQRKKRLLEEQQRRMLGTMPGASSLGLGVGT